MKVLLINSNRYKSPPVPPIGLEYLDASLAQGGHQTEIIDLCFSDNPQKDTDDAIVSFKPDIIGLTIRNVDSVLYHTNEFFLDEIKDIISHIKTSYGIKVFIGGTGVSANPDGVLEYVGADFAIAGPAEDTIHELINKIQHAQSAERILRGRYTGTIQCRRKPLSINYKKYVDFGGILGFETHKGCSSSCIYCLEANSKVVFKRPEDVVEEIKHFTDLGYTHFHLCDSEFNESLEYSIDFCSALKKSGLGIQWAVYMKPSNFNKNLAKLLKDTGVYLITLSVDTWKKCTEYWTDIEKITFGAKAYGIKVAIDLLTGFPYERDSDILECLDLLRRPLPDSIGINSYIRLYSSLKITKMILDDPKLKENLYGNLEDLTMIKPVFFNQISTEKLKELTKGESLFRLEGIEKGVNYLRV